MISWREIKDALLQLVFPHICTACGRELPGIQTTLCMGCIHAMPETNFELHAANPVEKIFWGRLPLIAATAQFYFTKESLMQELMHQLKYKGNKDLGIQLGRIMGDHLKRSGRFIADALVPLPLFPVKERKRGYNQATILCQGMAEVMHLPVLDKVVTRPRHTETQTRKGRVERWKNIDGKFVLNDPEAARDKHLLLIDDVVTTGATLESCGTTLLEAPGTHLSIATLCAASR